MHPHGTPNGANRSPQTHNLGTEAAHQARGMARAELIAPPLREPYIYVRVSTYVQAQEGFSLPKQFEVCHLQAKVDGHEIRPENVLHDIDSGAKFDRKFLTDILSRVKQGRVSALYCPEVDRLARDPYDGLKILEALRAYDVKLVLVKDKIDTSTDHGEMFFVMMLMFAKWERRQIKERTWTGKITKTNQYHKEDRPFYGGGRHVPYGLRWTPATKEKPGYWEIDHEDAHWVLKIFEWTAKGHSSLAVAGMLNERAVKSPTGGCWNDVTVRNIVKSTTYIGQYRYKLQGREYVFPVPRIVPDELFTLGHAALGKNSTGNRRNAKHDYLLASTTKQPLLKCLVCHQNGHEHMMSGRYGAHKDGRDFTFYCCSHRADGKVLRHKVGAKKIEQAVWQYLCDTLQDPTTVLARLKKLQDATSQEHQDIVGQLDGLRELAEENRGAQRRIAFMYEKGKINEEVLDERSTALEQEAVELEGKLALLQTQMHQAQANSLPLKEVEDACALLAEGLDEFTFEDKQWVIRTLVDVVYASRDAWRIEGKLPGLVDGAGVFGTSMSTHTSDKSWFLAITPTNLTFTAHGQFNSLSSIGAGPAVLTGM